MHNAQITIARYVITILLTHAMSVNPAINSMIQINVFAMMITVLLAKQIMVQFVQIVQMVMESTQMTILVHNVREANVRIVLDKAPIIHAILV